MPAPIIDHCPLTIDHTEHLWYGPDDNQMEGDPVRWCEGVKSKEYEARYLREEGDYAEDSGDTVQDAEGELRAWWSRLAKADADAVVPKAVEYSAYDLDIMGNALVAWSKHDWSAADAGERAAAGQEMAIAFYVLGKVSRLIGAYHEGRLPSDDTWTDIRIYATMAARVRQTGRWGL